MVETGGKNWHDLRMTAWSDGAHPWHFPPRSGEEIRRHEEVRGTKMGSEVPILRQPPPKKNQKRTIGMRSHMFLWLKMAKNGYGSAIGIPGILHCLSEWGGNRTSNLRSHGRKLGQIFSQGDCPMQRGLCVYIYEYSPVNQHSYGKYWKMAQL